MPRSFTITHRTTYYQDQYNHFEVLDATFDDQTGKWPCLTRRPCVFAIPLSPTGRTVIIRQHRFALNGEVWEFCCGARDVAGEGAAHTAQRELVEELGLHIDRAENLRHIGAFILAPGAVPTQAEIFVMPVADADLDALKPPVAEDQITDLRVLHLDDLGGMIDQGDIICGATLACYGRLRRYLDCHPELTHAR